MTKDELCRLEQPKLAKLIEQGKLKYIPFSVGDKVWKIKALFSYLDKPIEDIIDRIIILKDDIIISCVSGLKFNFDNLGEKVFLKFEDAEKKIKEMNGNVN
jgi:hypothetical protein